MKKIKPLAVNVENFRNSRENPTHGGEKTGVFNIYS